MLQSRRTMKPHTVKRVGVPTYARHEAEFFFNMVERGRCSVEQALNDLGIPPRLEPRLLRFAQEEHGINRAEILQTLELRRCAVEEFRRMLK